MYFESNQFAIVCTYLQYLSIRILQTLIIGKIIILNVKSNRKHMYFESLMLSKPQYKLIRDSVNLTVFFKKLLKF